MIGKYPNVSHLNVILFSASSCLYLTFWLDYLVILNFVIPSTCVNQQSANSRPTKGWLMADKRPTNGWQSAHSFARCVSWQLPDCRGNVGLVLGKCWLLVFAYRAEYKQRWAIWRVSQVKKHRAMMDHEDETKGSTRSANCNQKWNFYHFNLMSASTNRFFNTPE